MHERGNPAVNPWAFAGSLVLLAFVLCACERAPDRTATPHERDPSVLRRGLGAEPETLDPHLASDSASLTVVADLYEGLTTETADGRIVQAAAESLTTSNDGLAWSIEVRCGLRWSNGDPLTARDFAASLRAALAPDSQAPNAGLLEAIDRVDVAGDTTLQLHLARPLPYLPALLALPVAAPVHAPLAGTAARPGNGPYRLVAWRRGDRIELERNPYYRARADVRIDRVVHLPIADLATEFNLYRTGELDLASEVANAQLPWLREHRPDELRVSPYLSTYAYAVNLARLRDGRVRLALAMAVDRDRITQQVTGAGERPAYGWVPDGVPGYEPARFAWRRGAYDAMARRARELWSAAEAQRAAPSRITLCTDASANHHRTAVALADLWRRALGVETEIVEFEWNVYLDTRRHPGDCDLVRFGWSADFVDAEAFAGVFETGDPQNTLGYASARYDTLLRQSRHATDAAERAALLARAEAQLLEDVPVIPVFFRVSKRLVKPYVEGYRANPLGHVASRDLRITTR